MDDRILVNMDQGVADVRLVRSDKMNALDERMFDALRITGEELKTRPGLRAVVLSGEGRAFCAGLDVGEFGKMTAGEPGVARAARVERLLGGERRRTPAGANPWQQSVMAWSELSVPVIAAVHGVAFGGGFQLMLAADIRVVAPDTRLSVMEINWGLIPDMGGFALMRHLVRNDVARELVYTGRVFDGAEALQMGLATRLASDPRAEALAMARRIADGPPTAIRSAKRLLDLARHADVRTMLLAESREQSLLVGAAEQVEAVRARQAGRKPVYKDI